MNQVAVALALLLAAVFFGLALRLRWGLRAAGRVKAAVRWATRDLRPLPPDPSTPGLLEAPDRAEGWLLVTVEGICTDLDHGARTLLGGFAGEALRPPQSLADLFVQGETEAAAILATLRTQATLPPRRLRPAQHPDVVVEMAGIKLPDSEESSAASLLLLRQLPPA